MIVTSRLKRDGDLSKKLNRLAAELRGPTMVHAGFPTGSNREVVERATFNEFGAGDVPSRPFMRTAFAGREAELEHTMRRAAERVVSGDGNLAQAMESIGDMGATMIRERIINMSTPPNAASTVARKGFNDPLIESGEMRDSVTWKPADD